VFLVFSRALLGVLPHDAQLRGSDAGRAVHPVGVGGGICCVVPPPTLPLVHKGPVKQSTHTHTHTHTHARTHTHTHTHTHTRTHTRTHTHAHAHAHTRTHTHAHARTSRRCICIGPVVSEARPAAGGACLAAAGGHCPAAGFRM